MRQVLATVVREATMTDPFKQNGTAPISTKPLLHSMHVPNCTCPELPAARSRFGFDRGESSPSGTSAGCLTSKVPLMDDVFFHAVDDATASYVLEAPRNKYNMEVRRFPRGSP